MTKTSPISRPKLKNISYVFLSILLLLALSACHSSQSASYGNVDFRQLARAAIQLGFDIDENDNWQLMTASAQWLGTPYRYGGNTRSGVDCSGLTKAIYADVFHRQLHRRSIEQYQKDARPVHRSSLQSGDLVFFAPGGNPRNINHVGIYLKDGRFIHASTSRGVIVSRLDENYYVRNWVAGGRVR